jgi:hypothetical protein
MGRLRPVRGPATRMGSVGPQADDRALMEVFPEADTLTGLD